MPTDRRRALAATIAAVSLAVAAPAAAQVFVPPPARWLEKTPSAEQTLGLEALPPNLKLTVPPGTTSTPAATPVAKTRVPVGVSFGYVHRHEDIEVDAPGAPIVGKSEASVSVGRLDTTIDCELRPPFSLECLPDTSTRTTTTVAPIATIALNVGVLGGYADGHSTVNGSRLDLHGPAVGASTNLLILGPVRQVLLPTKTVFVGAPLVMGGFDYLATDYSAIEGWVHAYGAKPRAGLMVSAPVEGHTVFVYGGASWADFSEKQTLSDFDITTRSRPREPWAGLMGASYFYALGAESRDSLSLTLEGEVGDRTSVALSLRYAFNLPL